MMMVMSGVDGNDDDGDVVDGDGDRDGAFFVK